MNINTNLSSLTVQSSLKKSSFSLNQAIERMTTGFKVNHSSDNAANYSIINSMNTKISAYGVAENNAMMGLDYLETASSNLSLISNSLSRLRTLALQVQNGTYGKSSIEALNLEAKSIIKNITRLKTNTKYNGIDVLGENSIISNFVNDEVNMPKIGDNGFIENFEKRDCSKLQSFADVSIYDEVLDGTYSISSLEEFVKFRDMANVGRIKGGEFVLDCDIDLSAYSTGEGWECIIIDPVYSSIKFDGNGHKISNLYINRPDEVNVALFQSFQGELSNLVIENADIRGDYNIGAIAGYTANNTIINNCVVKNSNISGNKYAGGLVGILPLAFVKNSCAIDIYIDVSDDTGRCGGLVGIASGSGSEFGLENCLTTGTLTNQTGAGGGLIGWSSCSIKNCYSSVDIYAADIAIGGVCGYFSGSSMENCYATGNIVSQKSTSVGGLIGSTSLSTSVSVKNCYSTGNVNGYYKVGGLIGESGSLTTVENCYTTSNIDGRINLGGLVGQNQGSINNCLSSGEVTSSAGYLSNPVQNHIGSFVGNNLATGTIKSCYCEYTKIDSIGLDASDYSDVKSSADLSISLQVGINSDSSNISFNSSTSSFVELITIYNNGLDDESALSIIDKYLKEVNEKQVSIGAVQNRLESVIEEIGVHYENLVSSSSTLKDADLSEVSSEYIKNQILLQASMTLLATANQSPSIALQLI